MRRTAECFRVITYDGAYGIVSLEHLRFVYIESKSQAQIESERASS